MDLCQPLCSENFNFFRQDARHVGWAGPRRRAGPAETPAPPAFPAKGAKSAKCKGNVNVLFKGRKGVPKRHPLVLGFSG